MIVETIIEVLIAEEEVVVGTVRVEKICEIWSGGRRFRDSRQSDNALRTGILCVCRNGKEAA